MNIRDHKDFSQLIPGSVWDNRIPHNPPAIVRSVGLGNDPVDVGYLVGEIYENCDAATFVANYHPKPPSTPQHDPVNPGHYKGDTVMKIIEDFDLNFRTGNAIKYILRHREKGGAEDLKKAMWYLQRDVDRYQP